LPISFFVHPNYWIDILHRRYQGIVLSSYHKFNKTKIIKKIE